MESPWKDGEVVSWVYSGQRVLQVKSLLSTVAKGYLSTILSELFGICITSMQQSRVIYLLPLHAQ